MFDFYFVETENISFVLYVRFVIFCAGCLENTER